jgi:tetratricopeptide (TPR) repeat protein
VKGSADKVFAFLRALVAPRRRHDAEPLPAPTHQASPPPEEDVLAELVAKLATGMDPERIADPAFRAAIDALVSSGRTRLAAEWLAKFVTVLPDGKPREALCAELVTLLCDQGQLDAAVPHLEALARSPSHAARAHFLLGEHHQGAGDPAGALVHFEAVLALDVGYPNAKLRAQLLRQEHEGHADLGGGLAVTLAGQAARMEGARYQILGELGRGQAAAVYLARDVELSRQVAIKLLHPHLSAGSQAAHRARFFAEARMCSALRHPHIVSILDLDEVAKRIVMELAAGGTLRARLGTGPLELTRALTCHRDVLSALAAAHRLGIVHRDLSPANLLFRTGEGDDIMLADFGIAHLSSAKPQDPASRAVGTLRYMAPEQRQGRDVDARADVYAAGVILYETWVGRPPWDRETTLLGIRKASDLGPPETLTSSLPGDLGERLRRHLLALGEPDPHARPTTAEALAAAGALVKEAQALGELSRFHKERDEILGTR